MLLVMDMLCRLCSAVTSVVESANLFEDRELARKVEKHLHVKCLRDETELPHNVCRICIYELEAFDTFFEQCQSAQKAFMVKINMRWNTNYSKEQNPDKVQQQRHYVQEQNPDKVQQLRRYVQEQNINKVQQQQKNIDYNKNINLEVNSRTVKQNNRLFKPLPSSQPVQNHTGTVKELVQSIKIEKGLDHSKTDSALRYILPKVFIGKPERDSADAALSSRSSCVVSSLSEEKEEADVVVLEQEQTHNIRNHNNVQIPQTMKQVDKVKIVVGRNKPASAAKSPRVVGLKSVKNAQLPASRKSNSSARKRRVVTSSDSEEEEILEVNLAELTTTSYKCDECQRSFRRKVQFDLHMKTHTSKENVTAQEVGEVGRGESEASESSGSEFNLEEEVEDKGKSKKYKKSQQTNPALPKQPLNPEWMCVMNEISTISQKFIKIAPRKEADQESELSRDIHVEPKNPSDESSNQSRLTISVPKIPSQFQQTNASQHTVHQPNILYPVRNTANVQNQQMCIQVSQNPQGIQQQHILAPGPPPSAQILHIMPSVEQGQTPLKPQENVAVLQPSQTSESPRVISILPSSQIIPFLSSSSNGSQLFNVIPPPQSLPNFPSSVPSFAGNHIIKVIPPAQQLQSVVNLTPPPAFKGFQQSQIKEVPNSYASQTSVEFANKQSSNTTQQTGQNSDVNTFMASRALKSLISRMSIFPSQQVQTISSQYQGQQVVHRSVSVASPTVIQQGPQIPQSRHDSQLPNNSQPVDFNEKIQQPPRETSTLGNTQPFPQNKETPNKTDVEDLHMEVEEYDSDCEVI